MTVGKLDRRSILLLVGGVAFVLLVRFGVYRDSSAAPVVTAADSIPATEARLARLRQVVSMIPARETEWKRVREELAAEEKGMLAAETAAQAQAQLLEIVHRVAKAEGIDARGAEQLRIRPFGDDYGEVMATLSFNCAVEQLVNLMAALANEPQLVASTELRVSAGNPKQKTLQVRMAFSGLVPGGLVPKKQSVGAF